MKKFFMALGLMVITLSSYAAPVDELKSRLEKVSILTANFSQKVYAADKKLVQEGHGQLWIKRPNLFRWHMTDPDESLLVSDGKTLWFYNPFVEQVTISHLNTATDNTPFILITRNSDNEWKKYTIKQSGDNFTLTPKSKKSGLKPFEINVTKDGNINSFVAKEDDGQRSIYVLASHSNETISDDKFTFTVPKGVTIDDQR